MRTFINIFLISMAISSVIIILTDLSIEYYLGTICFIWLFFAVNFNVRQNLETIDVLIIISLGSLTSFTLLNLNNNFFDKMNLFIKITFLCYIVVLILMSIASYVIYFLGLKASKETKETFLTVRQKDFSNLKYYVKSFNVIGLNGRWGTGKTFITDHLKRDKKDQFEFVEIGLLSINLNEFQVSLINELENVLFKNRIFSKNSRILKAVIDNNSILKPLKGIYNILGKSASHYDAFNSFKAELEELDKSVVIIYEDIDRVKDPDLIKQIFSVSESLSSSKIKVIYQYYEGNLIDMGFSYEYLEKYIPFKMNITESNLFELVDFELNDNKLKSYDYIKLEDFKFLKEDKWTQRFPLLWEVFKSEKVIYLKPRNMAIRKIQHFLEELSNILSQEKGYRYNKELVIIFFLIKHFFEQFYERLTIEETALETIKFKLNSNDYTIIDLINKFESGNIKNQDLKDLFQSEENKFHYSMLMLLNFKFEHFLKSKEISYIEQFNAENYNDKKNRLIWNLLAKGKSEYTNYEYVGKKFISDVINYDSNKWIKKYSEFHLSLQNSDVYNDNQTIFKIRGNNFKEIFKALRTINVTEENLIKSLDCYFKIGEVKIFNFSLIHAMNFYYLKTKRQFIYTLQKLNNLEIVGNLKADERFSEFLNKYIDAINRFRFFNVYSLFDKNINLNTKYLELRLKNLTKNLKKLKERIQIQVIKNDLDVIIKFVEKLDLLVTCDESMKKSDSISTEINVRRVNEKEYNRLLKFANNNDWNISKREIEKSYLKEKIDVPNVDMLLKELGYNEKAK